MKDRSNRFGVLIISILTAVAAQAADLIPLGSSWKYVLGTQEASNPIQAWRQIVFNDAAWLAGAGPLGYDLSLIHI